MNLSTKRSKMETLRIAVAALICILLAVMTVEIVVRRIFVGQIPTQFSAAPVYLLLALNVGYIVWVIRRFRQRRI